MKNTHIPNLLKEVPKDIRLEVYKEALDIIINNKIIKSNSGYNLCILLPCLLWDLEDYWDISPNGETWHYQETIKAFPELTQKFINNINKITNINDRHNMRINLLQTSIKLLS